MKTLLRSGLLCLLLLCALALTACSGGVSRGEAKDATEALFLALSAGDYEEAASLFHPAAGITTEVIRMETGFGIRNIHCNP